MYPKQLFLNCTKIDNYWLFFIPILVVLYLFDMKIAYAHGDDDHQILTLNLVEGDVKGQWQVPLQETEFANSIPQSGDIDLFFLISKNSVQCDTKITAVSTIKLTSSMSSKILLFDIFCEGTKLKNFEGVKVSPQDKSSKELLIVFSSKGQVLKSEEM